MFNLLNNIWIKLIALAMGLLLWFHVATEKEYSHQLSLPVTEITVKDGLTLSKHPPDSIRVTVSATGKQLLRRKWRDRGVKISATQFQIGTHELGLSTENVSLAGDDVAIGLEEVLAPSTVTLEIDKEDSSDVIVIPDVHPKPAEGYAVAEVSKPQPKVITLFGPRSLLRRISSVTTVRRDLSGVRNDITLTLPIVPPSGYGVTATPDSVEIVIDIVPVRTKILKRVRVVVFNDPDDIVVQPNPQTVQVEISGPPEDVDTLKAEAVIASVDYTERNENNMAPITIQCPAVFKVKNISTTSARVTRVR